MKIKAPILLYFIFTTNSLLAQCPDKDSLWNRLNFLRNLPPTERLKKLQPYERLMQACPNIDDSLHAFFLRRLGMTYFGLSDFLNAEEYLRQAIKLNNSGKPSANLPENISAYFILSAAYDSLNNTSKKMEAVDRCINLAVKMNALSDISCVRSLYSKTEYYFNIGDYHRCIDYASMCEKFANQYIQSTTDKWNILSGKTLVESSLGWKINSMLILGKYQALEDLLVEKAAEYKRGGFLDYLGLAYAQLAEMQEKKGDIEKGLFLANKSLKCFRESKQYFNCKQTLKNIG